MKAFHGKQEIKDALIAHAAAAAYAAYAADAAAYAASAQRDELIRLLEVSA